MIPLILVIMLFVSGCDNKTGTLPDASSAKVSECGAIKIARTQVPQRLAEYMPNSGFLTDEGPNGTWFVVFTNIDATFDELTWKGNAGDYFKSYDTPQNKPEGIYANILIYVDANSGAITRREINNAFYLGPTRDFDCE